ncbi:MAG: DUF4406 domain-containing protein [Propionibacteriaceae bacterium]|nr:DUF4406 domain-containing protein [Propionibacteriaceae bacterium]
MRTAIISQPMNGISPDTVAHARAQAERDLAAQGYTPHDSVYNTDFDHAASAPEGIPNPAAWHIGAAIQRLAAANALYLAPGWETARGCRIERAVAEAYGIPVILGEKQQ